MKNRLCTFMICFLLAILLSSSIATMLFSFPKMQAIAKTTTPSDNIISNKKNLTSPLSEATKTNKTEQEVSNNLTLPLTLSTLPSNFLTYQNSTLGIQMRYPDDWLKNEIMNGNRIASLDSQDYVAQVHLFVNNFSSSLNLNESLRNVIEGYQNSALWHDFRLISSNTNSTLAGHAAYRLVFTATDPVYGNIEQIETGTFVGSKLYRIHVMVKANEFSNYLPIVKKMINSFKLLNIAKAVGEGQHQQPSSYHYVAINDTTDIGSNTSSTAWKYRVFTPAFGTNVTLKGAFKTSNGRPINVTLADIAKCGHHDNRGFVDYFIMCSESLMHNQLLPSGSNIQKTLLPGKLYNINFEDKVSNKNNIKINFAVNYKRDFIDYANYTHLGIRISYPYDWEKVQEDNGVKFFSPVQNGFQQNIFIDNHDIFRPENKTLDQLAKSSINNYRQVKTDFKLIDSNKTTLDGNGAYKIVFTYTEGQYAFKTMEISMIKNNKIYRIIYTAMPEKYFNYLPTIQKMIDSFRSVSLLPYKNPGIGINNLLYPSDWRRSENESQVYFYPPLEDNNNTHSVLEVRRFPSIGKTLDKVIGDDINYFKQNITGFRLTDSIVTNEITNGSLAYKIVYMYKNPKFEKQYKETDFYTIAGNAVYIISYIEQPERYYNYLDIMQQMLTSLKIQKANNSAQLDKPALKLANGPTGLTVNSLTHTLYIANGGSNTVSVINTKTNRIITNISVGSTPNDLYFEKTGNVLFVVNGGSNTVSIIDTLTNKVINNPKVGNTPANIDGDSVDGFVFVSNRDSNTVSVISEETGAVLSNINVGKFPYGVTVNPITHTLFVANGLSNTVSSISYYNENNNFSRFFKRTDIPVGSSPSGISVNPNTNMVYVTNDDNTISVIDGSLNRIVKTIKAGFGPYHLDNNPNTNMVYVANRDNTISVIDGKTNKITKTITLGFHPWDMTIDPNTNMVYVTNDDINEVYIINGTTNHVTAGVGFKMDSGNINCNGRNVSNNDYIIYDINTVVNCKAEPSSGFLFSSWSGDLVSNTYTNPTIQFNVSRYGTLTANFVKAPSPVSQVVLPKEYWDSIYSIVIGVIVAPIAGWLVPFVVDYKEKKRQLRYLRTYIPLIDNIYEKHHQNIGECMQLLEQERVDISALLQEGIINDSSFGILNDRISEYIDEINNINK